MLNKLSNLENIELMTYGVTSFFTGVCTCRPRQRSVQWERGRKRGKGKWVIERRRKGAGKGGAWGRDRRDEEGRSTEERKEKILH